MPDTYWSAVAVKRELEARDYILEAKIHEKFAIELREQAAKCIDRADEARKKAKEE